MCRNLSSGVRQHSYGTAVSERGHHQDDAVLTLRLAVWHLGRRRWSCRAASLGSGVLGVSVLGLVGFFKGLGTQRGIAWRRADSLSLQTFLGLAPTEEAPAPSSLNIIRERLPLEVHAAVFGRVLMAAREEKILDGQTLAVDSTTLEANAATKSIVRKDTGENWQAYLTTLLREVGLIGPEDAPCIDDMQRFDKARRGNKVSNEDWEGPTDPGSRITTMKDGTTHLAYKAEHAVDLESNLVVAAEIYHGVDADT